VVTRTPRDRQRRRTEVADGTRGGARGGRERPDGDPRGRIRERPGAWGTGALPCGA